MVQIKSPRELDAMRRSGELVAKILFKLAQKAQPGVTLLELNDLAERLTLEMGARPAFKGYLGFAHSLCTSVNEQVVHGIPSTRTLKEGDIVGLDFGLEYKGFYGDSAITIPIGKPTPEAKKLMQVTKDSLYAGIDAAREGNTLRDVAKAIESTVKPNGYGVVKEFVGHGIGQKLHEEPQVPNFEAGASSLRLRAGMTIAIEPMINSGTHKVRVLADKWTVVTEDSSLSAHYEHTIAITQGEPEILTSWKTLIEASHGSEDLVKKGAYGERGSNPG